MLRRKAFTLIELLVVISIIALLISILMPALNKAREQASGTLCLGNQKTLTLAWIMYADENDGRLVFGSVHEYPGNVSPNPYRRKTLWVHPPLLDSSNTTSYATYDLTTWEDRVRGMEAGKLYIYTNTVEAYHCPGDKRSAKNEPPRDLYRSYSITHGVAGHTSWSHIKLNTIRRPASKHIFIEEQQDGFNTAYNSSAWILDFNATTLQWAEPVAVWHNKRSTLGFADGHAEMHGWVDDDTIRFSMGETVMINPDQQTDLEYMRRGYPHL